MLRHRYVYSTRFASCLTGLALFCAPAAKAQKHFPTNEEIRQVRTASAPKLSPDGAQIVAEITESTANGGENHIWLLPVKGAAFRQLRFSPAAAETSDDKPANAGGRGARGGGGGEHGAEWMPDGKSILFLARRGSGDQIFTISPAR